MVRTPNPKYLISYKQVIDFKRLKIMATRFLSTVCLLIVALPVVALEDRSAQPTGLYLTWQQDPTSTMTIDWHTDPDFHPGEPPTVVWYRAKGEEDWHATEGVQLPFFGSYRTVHRVELTGLEAGTEYQFRLGDFEREYFFRTMPTDLSRPLRIAVGGDTLHSQDMMERTNRVAMAYDPDFIIWGGDFAYADGRADRFFRWYMFFDAILNTLIGDDGRVIPIVGCIGNHEVVNGGYGRHADYEQTDEWREQIAPYFYGLMAFPGQPGYAVLDFGDYLSLVSLDTEHSNPIPGAQTEWLAEVLEERRDVPHLIPFYHSPAYPSYRGGGHLQRHNWVPLFDQNNVRLVFENHDHTYKRTLPLRGNAVNPGGIVYIGDGAWGVRTRPVRHEHEWYMAVAKPERHVIILTLHGNHQHVLVVNEDGEVIDQYPETPLPTPAVDLTAFETGGLKFTVFDQLRQSMNPVDRVVALPAEGWRFRLDPDNAGRDGEWYATELDDTDWDVIAVDKLWQESGYDYIGAAWYRLSVDLSGEDQASRAFIAFAQVDEQAWVYVNGAFVGEHTVESENRPIEVLYNRPFAIDITDHIKWGEVNQITVRVKNTVAMGGIWGAVEFGFRDE